MKVVRYDGDNKVYDGEDERWWDTVRSVSGWAGFRRGLWRLRHGEDWLALESAQRVLDEKARRSARQLLLGSRRVRLGEQGA